MPTVSETSPMATKSGWSNPSSPKGLIVVQSSVPLNES
jgi:hypothetical protein